MGSTTLGSLDLGGGSAEIAFTVSPSASDSPFYAKEILMNKTQHLYARSYLCYGHNEAHSRFLAYLVHSQVSQGIVQCLKTGLVECGHATSSHSVNGGLVRGLVRRLVLGCLG